MGARECTWEVVDPQSSKISENRCIEEGKKNSFTLPVSPLLQDGTAQYLERPPRPTSAPMRESEGEGVAFFYATEVSGYYLKTDCYVLCKPHSDHKENLFYINKR